METTTPRAKRKRGRTPLEQLDKRNHCVSVRLNDEELKLINAKRGNTKKGEWLRCAALDKLPKIIPEQNTKQWQDLGKLAGNINQIAHKLNTNKQDVLVLSEREIKDIKLQIKYLRSLLIGISNNERNAED